MLAKHMAQAHALGVGAQANQVVSACAHAHARPLIVGQGPCIQGARSLTAVYKQQNFEIHFEETAFAHVVTISTALF